MDPQVAIAIGTTVASLAAVGAIIVSLVVYKGQAALSARIASDQAALSAKIASDQSAVSQHIHENQMRLSQRQLLIPLWTYISSVDTIDPQRPIGPDIIKAVNTLELVALSCEGGMVDPNVIKRTFRELYLRLYDQVESVPNVPGRGISGKALLLENPAAMNFYEELKTEYMTRGKISRA